MIFSRPLSLFACLATTIAACSSTPTDAVRTEESAVSGPDVVDTSVAKFSAVDGTTVYVLATNGNLWREVGSSASRTLVDSNVAAFEPIDASNVFVLGTSGSLWREGASRVLVDTSVKSFDSIDGT